MPFGRLPGPGCLDLGLASWVWVVADLEQGAAGHRCLPGCRGLSLGEQPRTAGYDLGPVRVVRCQYRHQPVVHLKVGMAQGMLREGDEQLRIVGREHRAAQVRDELVTGLPDLRRVRAGQ